MIQVSKILLYPIKALDGVEVTEAEIAPGGALKYDRLYALTDPEGGFVNGKRYPRIFQLRAAFHLHNWSVTLSENDSPARQATFSLHEESHEIAAWVSDFMGFPVGIQRDDQIGFPDDTKRPGPTVISLETLREVNEWFPAYSAESIRRRFRANVEVSGAGHPFWEDHLFGVLPDQPLAFRVGEVMMNGLKPCKRCSVPGRDPFTGEANDGFREHFIRMRQTNLPDYVSEHQFPQYYALSVNTAVPASEAGKKIRMGDVLSV